ncbi:hypothetical protein DXG03_004783 [Asterophora parasitica]|uniref:Uncharacterized protein n=1 Tax=Asterophora parasitica TaxID=117018 RepID=A0A9P7G240_9AGAR|nr:hypothetical protein DXG03_004783 [Asterophora parasitica]
MLDSSPVALPPLPSARPLKRSASTVSLPTPPRTKHKRKGRAHTREYDTDTDSDGDNASDRDGSDGEERARKQSHKKRRTGTGKDADAEEEAFWLSESDGDAPDVEDGNTSKSKAPPALIYRRRLAATASTSSIGSAPASPPPSNRKATTTTQTKVALSFAPVLTPPPRTPEPNTRDTKLRGIFPMRDSPNNPFLVSPEAAVADSASPTPSPNAEPHTPTALQERPTVTYVFRGVRGTFPNPLYDHEHGRPRSPSARSKLPIEHPEYSPAPHCPPKLLFPPSASRKDKATTTRLIRTGSPSAGKGMRMGRGRTLEEEMRGRKSLRVYGSNEADGEEKQERGRKGARERGRSVTFSGSESGSGSKEDLDDHEGDVGASIKPLRLDFTA